MLMSYQCIPNSKLGSARRTDRTKNRPFLQLFHLLTSIQHKKLFFHFKVQMQLLGNGPDLRFSRKQEVFLVLTKRKFNKSYKSATTVPKTNFNPIVSKLKAIQS